MGIALNSNSLVFNQLIHLLFVFSMSNPNAILMSLFNPGIINTYTSGR